jgi:hypothetical protein
MLEGLHGWIECVALLAWATADNKHLTRHDLRDGVLVLQPRAKLRSQNVKLLRFEKYMKGYLMMIEASWYPLLPL